MIYLEFHCLHLRCRQAILSKSHLIRVFCTVCSGWHISHYWDQISTMIAAMADDQVYGGQWKSCKKSIDQYILMKYFISSIYFPHNFSSMVGAHSILGQQYNMTIKCLAVWILKDLLLQCNKIPTEEKTSTII